MTGGDKKGGCPRWGVRLVVREGIWMARMGWSEERGRKDKTASCSSDDILGHVVRVLGAVRVIIATLYDLRDIIG